MLPGLVSGYDSDSSSSSESGADARPSTAAGGVVTSTSTPSNALSNGSSFASKLGLPPPSSSSPSLSSAKALRGLTASLPPPKSSSSSSSSTSSSAAPIKRKNQIRIESLGELTDDEEHGREITKTDGTTSSTKKPKLEPLPSRNIASSHGLFGMLPAPSRKGPPTPPGKSGRQGEEEGANGNIEEAVGEARMTLHEIQGHGSSSKKGTAKGNADFRAMLGLKPIPSIVKAATGEEVSSGETPSSYKQPTLNNDRSSNAIPSASAPVNPTGTTSQTSARPSTSTQPKKPPRLSSPPMDFFSLSSPTSSDRPSSLHPTTAVPSRMTISSAPSIEETPPIYTGWHQNPDGSWIPVTPEAIAAYDAHRAATSLIASGDLQINTGTGTGTGTDMDMNTDDRELKKLRDQGIDLDSLASVDLEATRIQWEQRPIEAQSGPDSAQLNAKYAAAAGLATQLDDEDDDEDDDGTERRRSKKKNGELAGVKDVRGKGSKGRGQLSSLIAQAAERKDELQQKWAQGKSNRAAASNRYGW